MTTLQGSKPFQMFRLISYCLLICFCIPFLTSCESNKTIVNGLDEKDANEILVFLSSRNIEAEKVKAEAAGGGGGSNIVEWNVVVKSTEAPEAMRLLNQQGLPRRKSQNLLGIFSQGGLVPSDLQEKIKYRAALAEQLASTIRKYEGILDADVQVSFPEEDPLNPGKMKGKITASVWLKHSGILDDPNSHLRTKIQRFVASSVTGLDPDDVTVIGERSRLGEAFGEGFTNPEEEKQYVKTWSVVIAKDSLTRFRVLFFAFTMTILLLLLTLLWFLWKLLPVLKNHGGIKSLFSLHPIESGPGSDKKITAPLKPVKKEDDKGDQGQIDRDIDET